jgi:glycosyltransferase family protein
MNLIYFIYEKKDDIKYYIKRRQLKIASIEETIKRIISDKCSISRFGDGEFYLMDGKSIKFQESNEELSKRLKEIITSDLKNHLICIGGTNNPINYKRYTKAHLKWTKKHFEYNSELTLSYLSIKTQYYDTHISRFWIPFKDKKIAKKNAEMLKAIWQNRDVVIIEGQGTRLGVGNSLLDNVKSCRRIIAPPENAYTRYDEIMDATKKIEKGVLFLIALGPTATVLAYDLHLLGYQALDIGHVDIEYEWMNMGVLEQVRIQGKHVNEVNGGTDFGECEDTKYLSEIISKIV